MKLPDFLPQRQLDKHASRLLIVTFPSLSPIRAIRSMSVFRVKNSPLTMIHSPFTIFYHLSSFLFPLCSFAQHPERVVSVVLKMHFFRTIPLLAPYSNRVSNALFYEGNLFEPRFECLFYERKPFEPPFPSRTARGKGKSTTRSASAFPSSNLKSEIKNRKSKIVNRKSRKSPSLREFSPCAKIIAARRTDYWKQREVGSPHFSACKRISTE
jgi:hypothetical protein